MAPELAAPDPTKPYHVGGGISAPVALYSPEAHYSIEARQARTQGNCLITLIVDARGMPQNPHIVKSLPGLNDQALEAVRRYRFHPAMKGGKIPVPVMVTIEVNFRLY